jgi:hypothetical protein
MQNTLAKLQALQAEAYNKGIHSFQITAWTHHYEDEDETTRAFFVTIFLTGDDSDEDYLSVDFHENSDKHDAKIERIKTFIGV